MLNMKEFVKVQLGEHTVTPTTTPVSFRCSDKIVLKMDLLSKYLGFPTRSKLLSELIPIALEDAIAQLPSGIAEELEHEYNEKLQDHYEYLATKDL